LVIVTATEPDPLTFAFSVKPPVTNTAVAVMLPDTVADTVLPSEFRDAVSLIHLENVLPDPAAANDIGSPEAIGIALPGTIAYDAPLIVTTTEPDPLTFAVNVKPPVTKYAVATRLPDTNGTDTVLLSECKDAVSLTHLENASPVAVMDIESSVAMGITVLAVMVYAAPLIVTATKPVPLTFAVNVKPPVTKYAVAERLPDTVAVTVLLSECKDAVSLTHLENTLPAAVIDIESPVAMGIIVLALTV